MLQHNDRAQDAFELDFDGARYRMVESGYVRARPIARTAPNLTNADRREVRAAIARRKLPEIRRLMRASIKGRAI